jgi:hypothetical protein
VKAVTTMALCFAESIDRRWRRRRHAEGTTSPAAPADSPVLTLTAGDTAGCEAEGRLARRLMAGRIDRAAYRRAMTELADHDARSRPLRVPEDRAG